MRKFEKWQLVWEERKFDKGKKKFTPYTNKMYFNALSLLQLAWSTIMPAIYNPINIQND